MTEERWMNFIYFMNCVKNNMTEIGVCMEDQVRYGNLKTFSFPVLHNQWEVYASFPVY